jgi:predicted dehydrogenase
MGIKKIKIGIIGSGYMAQEYVKVLKSIKKVEITGVVSKNLNKTKKFAYHNDIRFFSSIDQIYNKTKPDAFIIAVSELSLKTVLIKIFKFKTFNLVEKPIGINFEESKFITKLSKKTKSKNFVGFNRRHYENIKFIKKKIKNDKSKRIVFIEDQEYQNYNSTIPRKVLKNWMYANSVHLIDLFYVLCRGKILSIKNKIQFKSQKYSFILSEIKFNSGDLGIYKCLWNTPGPWSISVNTDKKNFTLRPLEKLFIQDNRSRRVKEIDFKSDNFKHGVLNQLKLFIKSIEQDKDFLPNFEDSLQSMKLVKKIYG